VVYEFSLSRVTGTSVDQSWWYLTGRIDFLLGLPERINPGDKAHTLEKIVKVVAGEDAETLESGLPYTQLTLRLVFIELSSPKLPRQPKSLRILSAT